MYNDPDYFDNDEETPGTNMGWPYTKLVRHIQDELKDLGVTGFYMGDEPFMTINEAPYDNNQECYYASMDTYSKLVEWFNTYYEGLYWHMNMVPSSSYDHFPTGSTYADFIKYYVDNIIANVNTSNKTVSMDNYPFLDAETNKIAAMYLADLLVTANAARDYNLTAEDDMKTNFGTCIQIADSSTLLTIDSVEKITFQLYTAMACGANTFEYFGYGTLGDVVGALDASGNKTAVYNYLKLANEKALGFAKVLESFTWDGLNTYGAKVGTSENAVAFTNAESYTLSDDDMGVLTNVDNNSDVVIGKFSKEMDDGYIQDGYMLVNYSAPQNNVTNTTTLTFKGCTNVIVYTEGVGVNYELNKEQITINLAPGEAVFIIAA